MSPSQSLASTSFPITNVLPVTSNNDSHALHALLALLALFASRPFRPSGLAWLCGLTIITYSSRSSGTCIMIPPSFQRHMSLTKITQLRGPKPWLLFLLSCRLPVREPRQMAELGRTNGPPSLLRSPLVHDVSLSGHFSALLLAHAQYPLRHHLRATTACRN